MPESDRELLRETAAQLERWAVESRTGGWSTHQVDRQRDLAHRILVHLGRQDTGASAASERTTDIIAHLIEAKQTAAEIDRPGLWLAIDLIRRRFG